MRMTKQEAEAEAIRRWYELPEDMRQIAEVSGVTELLPLES